MEKQRTISTTTLICSQSNAQAAITDCTENMMSKDRIVASFISVKMNSLLSVHLVMLSRRICVIQTELLLANDTLTQKESL